MTPNKLLLFLALILLNTQLVFSQKITIVNKATLSPISEVEVTSDNGIQLISNHKGHVDLSKVEADELVYFLHTSYKLLVQPKSKITNDTIFLVQKTTQLPTATVSASLRDDVNVDDEPHQAIEIDLAQIRREKPATSADLLQYSGQVFVQKSQGGGGSPIIRGFEANKLLMVIDGVRLNNAIYRSGHLQNSITIDPSILRKTEVIFGPNSVLYGSDAMGGVIHFHTANPILADSTKWATNTNYSSFYNSNNNSTTTNLNYSIAQKKWGVLTSISYAKFGDFSMGKNRFHKYSDWGLQQYTVSNINGVDSMLKNTDANLQKNTAYYQTDALAKLIFKPNKNLDFSLNIQYSKSSNINRFDKLNEYKNGILKYAEWYYGPQKRLLTSFKTHFISKKKWVNSGTFILSYQKIDEDRISRKFQSNNRAFQIEDVNVFALNLDLNKVIDSAKMLYYGFEIQHNIVSSNAFISDITTKQLFANQTRYPDGGSQYLSSGLYVEYKQQLSPKMLFTTGVRFSYLNAQSTFNDTSFIKLPFNTINLASAAPSGNLGFIYQLDSKYIIKASASTAYRAPNVDDYGKVFEKKGNTVIPTENLKPEYALNGELFVERIFKKRIFTLGTAFYYTYLFNAIVRSDYSLNGVDSILYDGEMTNIQTNVNTDKAQIFGVSTYFKWRLHKHLFLNGTYNFTKGNDISNKSPLTHISPQFGKIDISYAYKKINTAIYTYYNFRKQLKNYGGSSDNLDESPNNEGTPAWATLNYRISYTTTNNMTLQFSATNILDTHYKQFSSAISAPGRSFMGGIRLNF